MKTNYLFVLLFSLLGMDVFAQGTLRGTVYDESTGETVPFATVIVGDTGDGTTTDLDGTYELNLAAGTYTLTFQYLGYADKVVSDVVFTSGKVETLDVMLSEEGETIETVVVTAKQIRTTEAAMATLKKKSTNLVDGISSQTFSKLGDSNAGEALKRVTGVSVEGGKHVFVRGLGDRYTKTILNGMEIPGLDPDKNSFEMDLLPTNLIDNILVYKTFTPDLPGDFTGGIVNVITKDYPEEQFTNISVGLGYNPSMHFNSDFIRQERSGTDFLAMDNGVRENPISSNIPALLTGTVDEVRTITSKFKDNAGVINKSNDLNKSISISTGNQLSLGAGKFSYLAALNYKNNSTFYEKAKFNTYKYDNNVSPGEFLLTVDNAKEGAIGIENNLWSALVGLGYKVNTHKITFQAMRIQNGISKAADQSVSALREDNYTLIRDVLEYAQREVTNFNFAGKHLLDEKLTINWKLSPTFVEVDEPDIRLSAFEKTDDGRFIIAENVGAIVSRSWRNLKESNYSGKVDIEYNLGGDRVNKLKIGGLGTYKKRDFGITNYNFSTKQQDKLNFGGDASNIFNSDNIIKLDGSGNYVGVYAIGGSEPANNFKASQTLISGYLMHTYEVTDKLKAIYGVRLEKALNKYTGQNNAGTIIYNDKKVLDKTNLLPSLNLVYALKDNSNIRASYNRTLARPTFKEISIAQIQDRISGRTFLGNIDLKQTTIDNFDLRYELFASGGQTFSLSGFYKLFYNPIELVSYSDQAPDNFQPRNVADEATVFGAELEVSNKLDFISEALSTLTAGINFTYVNSRIERSNAASLPSSAKYRSMVGQAPYIINGTLGYKGVDNGIEVNASYNVQGKKLYLAGFGSLADVYTMPFHSLNMKASKKFGTDNRYKVSLSVNNILGSKKEKEYQAPYTDAQKEQSLKNKTGIFESLDPGRTFSLGFSAKL